MKLKKHATMKFVIVDDDVSTLELMSLVLEAAGHEVIAFESSLHALREIPIVRPDCVITDVIMPEMDGFELCRELRGRADLAGIKIIMCTSKAYDFDRREQWDEDCPSSRQWVYAGYTNLRPLDTDHDTRVTLYEMIWLLDCVVDARDAAEADAMLHELIDKLEWMEQ